MKQLLKYITPDSVWQTGLALVGIGEIWGAFFDKKKGGTISEAFWKSPLVVQFLIIFAMGGVFVHFIRWVRVLADGSLLPGDTKEGAK